MMASFNPHHQKGFGDNDDSFWYIYDYKYLSRKGLRRIRTSHAPFVLGGLAHYTTLPIPDTRTTFTAAIPATAGASPSVDLIGC
ncbi:hypothetical protein M0657_000075 [Pyricularia oryzae]|uniref:Uncharacterized protein n=1 Tax=Pyricularia oryzae TaxID=318829 RepID=A0A4P7N206_PYROR|nr:hypothetical protein M9X92_000139 [Pyricularia oryzae]KAI7932766.1 hypothetical protein M0657_000075 [Pyricularia oryzae]QBZ56293.1 hypothetical protein PoMZ_01199 [Pyricularia oryzae]